VRTLGLLALIGALRCAHGDSSAQTNLRQRSDRNVPQKLCIGGQTFTLAAHDEFDLDATLNVTDRPPNSASPATWSDQYSFGRVNTGLDGTDDSFYPSLATVQAWSVPPVVSLVRGEGVALRAYPVPAAHARDAATVCIDGTCRGHLAGLLTSPQAYANGYWEYEAQIPTGQGWWPALWLLNESGSGPYAETDVVEAWGPSLLGANVVQQTQVVRGDSDPNLRVRTTVPTAASAMHTYAALVGSSNVVFYIDGKPTSGRIPRPNAKGALLNPVMNLESCTSTTWCAPAPPAGTTESMLVEHYRYYAPPTTPAPCAPPYDLPAPLP
jgi:hypothetical protein